MDLRQFWVDSFQYIRNHPRVLLYGSLYQLASLCWRFQLFNIVWSFGVLGVCFGRCWEILMMTMTNVMKTTNFFSFWLVIELCRV